MSDYTQYPDIQYPDYLKGKLKVLGTPKTAVVTGHWNGEDFEAPLECWIAALVDMLSVEQKGQFFPLLKKVTQQWELQAAQMAEVRAIIKMPQFKE